MEISRNDPKARKAAAVTAAALVAALSAGVAGQALAEEASIEEIVVTAQKREQRLHETPVAVQAFAGELLDDISVRDLNEVMTLVPGASEELSNTPGLRRFQIRGIAQSLGDSTVGYYVNEAAFIGYQINFAPVARTFDIERVEVLRGPQSTLYGNGSMGGTVRYITRKPDLVDFEGAFRAAYTDTAGGDNGNYFDGVVSIPLVEDRLGVRVAASQEVTGGYQEDALGNEDINEFEITTVRGEMLWRPADSVSVEVMALTNEAESDGGTLLISLDPPIGSSFPGDYNNNYFDLYSGTLEWDLGFATLTANVARVEFDNESEQVIPFPFAPGGLLSLVYATDSEALNSETRLVSQGDGPLQWVLGFFYSDSESEADTATNLPSLLPPTQAAYGSESVSVFGEISYSLMDGTLIPLVGLRYFTDDRDSATIGGGVDSSQDDTFDSWNPRFNLQWLPREDTNLYINIAKGFRSGIFNSPFYCSGLHRAVGGLPCTDAVDSDTLWSYELGAKWTLANGQLLIDLAGYYMDWQDVHQVAPFLGLFQSYQFGDAEVIGLDIGLLYAPASIEGLTVQVTANFNQSEFVDLDPTLDATVVADEGDELPFVPDMTLSATASYSWSLTGNWLGHASLTYSRIGSQLGQFGTDAEGDDRDLLRARIGASIGNFGVYLFGKNLLDESDAIYSQTPAMGFVTFTQDYPRQIGVEVGYDF